MKILGKEFEVDFFEANNIEAFENAYGKIKNIEAENEKSSVVVRNTCKIIIDCVDTILGEGSSNQIFGDKTSLMLCAKAFSELAEERELQESTINKMLQKYSPDRLKRGKV